MKKTIVLLLFIAVNYSLLLAQTSQVKYPIANRMVDRKMVMKSLFIKKTVTQDA